MSPAPTLAKRLYPLAFMLALTLVFMSAVSGAYLATHGAVERNRTLFIKRAVLQAAGLTPPADNAAVEALYKKSVFPAADGTFDVADPEGAVRVLPGTGAGLWGRIDAMVGLREDGTLAGIAFTAQNETPGLGARIQEAWFRDQFKGKKAPLSLVPEKTRSGDAHEIDGITGASITSRAVRDLVNRAGPAAAPAPAPEGGSDGGG
jgi:Na+-transporting NADH:ubiquinone oxidoreductase subunit C